MPILNYFIDAQLAVANSSVGIPGLPDLTQPQQLLGVVRSMPLSIAIFFIILIGLGLALALLNFSLKPHQESSVIVLGNWITRYTQLLQILQQVAVILIVLVFSSLICFTLANRYHAWEYSRFARFAVTSSQMEQLSPQLRYTVKEPYNYMTLVDGQTSKVRDEKDITKILAVNSSNLQVKISRILVQNAEKAIYSTNFLGEYDIKNTIPSVDKFILTMPPPAGFSLLENFSVEQDGQKLVRNNTGAYEFPIQVTPNGTTQLRVSYQVQGAPRWLYKTKGELLSNFNLSIDSNFKNLDVLNSLLPSRIEKIPNGKTISWTFTEGAAVPYPFGAGTIVNSPAQTGVIPRLLMAAPAIWLWWLMLLRLSIPLRLRDLLISAGVAVSSMITLAYTSRLLKTEFATVPITPEITWLVFSLLLISLAWGLGKNWRSSLAAIVCTIAGLILPVFGLLNNYNGLTLSLAALLSIVWLVVLNWHQWYTIEPRFVHASELEADFDEQPTSYLKLDAGEDESIGTDLKMSLQTDQTT